MDVNTSRRELRRLRKERAKLRSRRVLVAFVTAGLFGSLAIGSPSVAMAAEDLLEGDTGAQTLVSTAPEQGDSAPEQQISEPPVAPPAVDAPVPDAPASNESTPSQDAPATDPPAANPTPPEPVQSEVAPQQSTVVVPPTEVSSAGKGGGDPGPKKVFVCKYVGTPGADERLQTGNNPISVSVNTLKGFPGTFPWAFPDAHGRSIAIAYDVGQPEPSVSECPQPEGPEEPPFDWNWQYDAPTCTGLTVVYPNNIPAGSNNKDVNIRVKDLVSGDVRTFNFHDSNFITSGKTVTYKVTEHPNWPGWTYYEVQWTQVHGTNYHWEGSVVCGTPPPAECVQSPTWSYTFDGVGSGTITVKSKGAEQGDTLCDALAVRATTFKYDLPASGNPSWPQTLVGYNDLLVDTIGTFSYAAPALDVCRQHDIYAEFVKKGGFDALGVPEKLNGPNNPYEPKFLHQTLSNKGPNPTYSTTTSDGCNTPPAPPEPKVKFSNWQDSDWVCGDTEVTQTRTKTTTPYKMVLQNGKWVSVEDTANIKVESETQTRALTEQEIESCKPTIPEPKVTYTQWTDEEWICGDETVTQTRTKTTTPWVPVLVSGSTWELRPDTANAVVTTETQTRALTEQEIESCKPTIPEPKVTYTNWEDQKWECGATEVTQTRTKTVSPYKVVFVNGSTWKVVEDTENVSTMVETQTRVLSDDEVESCMPDTPEPKVTYTNWQDEEWVCGDESVTQTRTMTTTPYKVVLVEGSTWKVVEDTENISTTVETQTRALTSEEIESCKPTIPEPKVEYGAWQDQKWVCGDTEVTQTRTKTTTSWIPVLVSGSTWELRPDTANAVVTTETQTRALTGSEKATCPTGKEKPKPPAKPTTGNIVPGGKTDGFGLTESSANNAALTGFSVGSVLLLALSGALLALRRRRSLEQE
ncbi:MAG: hypothetical protein ACREGE_03645 [Candidatus Microsaccharimonas sp.]